MVVSFDYPTCSSESKVDPDQHTPLLLGLARYTTAVYIRISVSHTHHDKMAYSGGTAECTQFWVPSQYLA